MEETWVSLKRAGEYLTGVVGIEPKRVPDLLHFAVTTGRVRAQAAREAGKPLDPPKPLSPELWAGSTSENPIRWELAEGIEDIAFELRATFVTLDVNNVELSHEDLLTVFPPSGWPHLPIPPRRR